MEKRISLETAKLLGLEFFISSHRGPVLKCVRDDAAEGGYCLLVKYGDGDWRKPVRLTCEDLEVFDSEELLTIKVSDDEAD